jgi:hypothetical protein
VDPDAPASLHYHCTSTEKVVSMFSRKIESIIKKSETSNTGIKSLVRRYVTASKVGKGK